MVQLERLNLNPPKLFLPKIIIANTGQLHIAARVQSQTMILLATQLAMLLRQQLTLHCTYTAISQGSFIDHHQSCSHAANHELSKLLCMVLKQTSKSCSATWQCTSCLLILKKGTCLSKCYVIGGVYSLTPYGKFKISFCVFLEDTHQVLCLPTYPLQVGRQVFGMSSQFCY